MEPMKLQVESRANEDSSNKKGIRYARSYEYLFFAKYGALEY